MIPKMFLFNYLPFVWIVNVILFSVNVEANDRTNIHNKTMSSAIIVTGGYGAETSVELLLDDGSPWCRLPNLPGPMQGHTQSGLVACGGGGGSGTSCVTFTGGE